MSEFDRKPNIIEAITEERYFKSTWETSTNVKDKPMKTNFTTFWNLLFQACMCVCVCMHVGGWRRGVVPHITGNLRGTADLLSYPSSIPNQSQNVKTWATNIFWIQSESLLQLHLPPQQLLPYFRLLASSLRSRVNITSWIWALLLQILKYLLSFLVIKRLPIPVLS